MSQGCDFNKAIADAIADKTSKNIYGNFLLNVDTSNLLNPINLNHIDYYLNIYTQTILFAGQSSGVQFDNYLNNNTTTTLTNQDILLSVEAPAVVDLNYPNIIKRTLFNLTLNETWEQTIKISTSGAQPSFSSWVKVATNIDLLISRLTQLEERPVGGGNNGLKFYIRGTQSGGFYNATEDFTPTNPTTITSPTLNTSYQTVFETQTTAINTNLFKSGEWSTDFDLKTLPTQDFMAKLTILDGVNVIASIEKTFLKDTKTLDFSITTADYNFTNGNKINFKLEAKSAHAITIDFITNTSDKNLHIHTPIIIESINTPTQTALNTLIKTFSFSNGDATLTYYDNTTQTVNISEISFGAGTPAGTPPANKKLYIDTTNNLIYANISNAWVKISASIVDYSRMQFVDCTNGNDTNSGSQIAPKKTTQAAHDAFPNDTNYKDIVVLVGNETNPITISKSNVRIVGQGGLTRTHSTFSNSMTISGTGFTLDSFCPTGANGKIIVQGTATNTVLNNITTSGATDTMDITLAGGFVSINNADLGGKNIKISGSGTAYIYNSANATYSFGTIIGLGLTKSNSPTVKLSGTKPATVADYTDFQVDNVIDNTKTKPVLPGLYVFTATPSNGLPSGVTADSCIYTFDGTNYNKIVDYNSISATIFSKTENLTYYKEASTFKSINIKANLASPAFTGTPTAPTASTGTNTTQIATTAFVKTEIASTIASLDVMVFKGMIDASTNPNYPAGNAGETYRISVAGKIGGASGINVEIGDILICLVDNTVSGNHATVGSNWNISQVNADGSVTSQETTTADNDFIVFSGTSGKVVKKTTQNNFKTLLGLTKSDVGLSNVDNTADANKNVLSATKLTTARTINGVAFDGTQNITIPSGSVIATEDNATTSINFDTSLTEGTTYFTNTSKTYTGAPADLSASLPLELKVENKTTNYVEQTILQNNIQWYRAGAISTIVSLPWKKITTADSIQKQGVIDILSTPPVSPANGDAYVVGTSPTGAWSSFTVNNIARYSTSTNSWSQLPASTYGIITFTDATNAFIINPIYYQGGSYKYNTTSSSWESYNDIRTNEAVLVVTGNITLSSDVDLIYISESVATSLTITADPTKFTNTKGTVKVINNSNQICNMVGTNIVGGGNAIFQKDALPTGWVCYTNKEASPYILDSLALQPQIAVSLARRLKSSYTGNIAEFSSAFTGGGTLIPIDVDATTGTVQTQKITANQNGAWIALKNLYNQSNNTTFFTSNGGQEFLFYQTPILERDCFNTKGIPIPRAINGRKLVLTLTANLTSFYTIIVFLADGLLNNGIDYGRVLEIGDNNTTNHDRANKIAFHKNNTNNRIFATYWSTLFGSVNFDTFSGLQGASAKLQILGIHWDGATLKVRSNWGSIKNGITGSTSSQGFIPGFIGMNAISIGSNMLSAPGEALNGGIAEFIMGYNANTITEAEWNSLLDKQCSKFL